MPLHCPVVLPEFLARRGFQVAPGLRRELKRPGSLSQRLGLWCQGSLPVTLVRQGPGRPSQDEARLLGLRSRELVWVREVRLGPPGRPWVRGRTVVPLREMRGALRGLRGLGTRPLGSVLFNGRGWHRSPFQIGWLSASTEAQPLPARRSVFYHGHCRLLVTEGFYGAFWQRLHQPDRPVTASSTTIRQVIPAPDERVTPEP